ncbi:serine/threonine protein kinase [Sediminihabitans luteus]|uniref:non-specific serine/threonine protein kinase n=1 Tax=Sediminihabitans luteus TaxID=1138585 RepID=A0A2M9CZE4_9CELL|nr:serine/threonine-protein kinase [Sediminihabitans luteus]PJJ77314.1 serine/threonine protein kinase [Sediminihabitans luteus]GII98765.1 serine/threonine protein kinase [Sediminihabitans luteus]
MSSRRVAAPPPRIDGYEYVSTIGSGGFSDVYCYQQHRPRRRVAVKVLLQEWSSEAQRAAFDAEADLLATLSTHPSIVTMYEARVADDGRPFLAMEYCSRPNMGSRYRTERMGVPEVLRTAVLIAGAVETAHRAGILHRDIKPANLLVTDYGHPVLTDFGISSTVAQAERAEGMSVPWSPPESFAEVPTSSVATDVWALAATTYSLLAGRTPFEVPGGSNGNAAMMARIESSPVPPIGRTDVPASLERVLATAMAKNPSARYGSALALARAFQSVQAELSLAPTPIDVLADTGVVQDPVDDVADDPFDADPGTRLRQVVTIDPDGPGLVEGTVLRPAGGRAPAPAPVPSPSTTGTRPTTPAFGPPAPAPTPYFDPASAEAVEDTLYRPVTVGADGQDPSKGAPHATTGAHPGPEQARGGRAGWVPFAVGAVVLAGLGAGAFALLSDAGDEPAGVERTADETDAVDDVPADNIGGIVPPVTDLQGEPSADGSTIEFTWTGPEGIDDQRYIVRNLDPAKDYSPVITSVASYVAPASSGDTCVEVAVVVGGRESANPEKLCVGADGEASS